MRPRFFRLRPRSIRQIITCGATVGLVMLLSLATASLAGLYLYNNAISDLDYAVNQMPQKSELAYEFSRLLRPLKLHPKSAEARVTQRKHVLRVLADIEAAAETFRTRADQLPVSRQKVNADEVNNRILARIDEHIRTLRYHSGGLLSGLPVDARAIEVHDESIRWMESILTKPLMRQVEALPQLRETLSMPLARSRRKYHKLVIVVTAITAAAVCLFASLVYFGFRGISRPIQKLVRGARRVAQREFDYRIEAGSLEEMKELADAFNLMTDRFQEAENELAHQVEERSRQLVRSERLADVGFIAAGVSHEINNPLHAIMGAAESLKFRLPELAAGAPEEEIASVREYLAMIQKQSQRCSRITSMLKDFARRSDDVKTATDLVRIVDEVLQMVGHLSKYRDRRITFDRKGAAIVEVNASEIQQVVLNLVSNALESMQAGGVLEIRILDQADFVVMEFEDDGCGMTEDVLTNLFEPFYTQRRNGGGTGLGLSITDRIVKEHQGTIEVSSDGPGCGSLFRIRLPRTAAHTEAA